MKTKFAAAFFAILSVGVVGGACNTEVEVEEESEFDDEDLGEFAGMDPETTFFTRTQVTQLPDGTVEIIQDQVSLAEQIAEREAEESGLLDQFSHTAALTESSSCSPFGGYLRMYSSTNYTGNLLCLSGVGSSSLSAWLNGSCYWGDHWWATTPLCDTEVRSYKTGSYVTEFVHSFPGDTYYWCEPANKNVPNHGGGATIVERDSACSPQ